MIGLITFIKCCTLFNYKLASNRSSNLTTSYVEALHFTLRKLPKLLKMLQLRLSSSKTSAGTATKAWRIFTAYRHQNGG